MREPFTHGGIETFGAQHVKHQSKKTSAP